MRLAPEDPALRKILRHLAMTNAKGGEQKVLFLDSELKVVEVVYEGEITNGGHVLVRDQLLDQAKLRAILHLGLVRDHIRRVTIHVVDSDADRNRTEQQQIADLLTLYQKNDNVFWVPTSHEAQEAWSESWFHHQ